MVHSPATAYHIVSDREQVIAEEENQAQTPMRILAVSLVDKGRRQIYVTQLHLSSSSDS